MPGTREIKRRIKSVTSTKKITKAMEMISAVKMRKAQQAALNSREYSNLAWQIVTNLSHRIDPKYHSLLKENGQGKKIGMILVSTNRGQVGAFNTNLVVAAVNYISGRKEQTDVFAELITVGKKGKDAMIRLGHTIVAEFNPVSALHIREVAPISKIIIDEYLKGTYDQIVIVYTKFISTVNQKAAIKQLLPLKQTGEAHDLPEHYKKFNYEYLIEPDPEKVLDYLLPRIIESQIYQALLESDASEHSARMVMMKNATDAAGELIDDLTLTFNQIRQSNITKELAEITAGRIALE